MLSGFNTNIRHRGVLFHVQSEDSGLEHPHIITHLFHGGNIMFSEKSSYADHVDDAECELRVKELMEGQHKTVLKRLRAGDFDVTIAERLGPDALEATGATTESRAVETDPVVVGTPEPEPDHGTGGSRFGEGIVSEKPLDEVILNYLVDNARTKRRRSPGK
jgi:hypothetical protein